MKSILNRKTRDEIEKLKSLIKQHHFLMISGGVAVGKTLYAKAIAYLLINNTQCPDSSNVIDEVDSNDCVKLIALHPGKTYENMVYGIRVSTEKNHLAFQACEREVVEFCNKARHADSNYVLILDDIHRTDISHSFGDLLSALDQGSICYEEIDSENRISRSVRIDVPTNLYIIATYHPLIGKKNIDYAWLRRFYLYHLSANSDYIIETKRCYKPIGQVDCKNSLLKGIINKNGLLKKPHGLIIGEEGEKDISNGSVEIRSGNHESYHKLFREYQWEIYKQIEILYKRYCYDSENISSLIPGHGLFCLVEGEDDETRYTNFHLRLSYCIYPMLMHHYTSKILSDNALLTIDALKELGEQKDLKYSHTITEMEKKNVKGKKAQQYVGSDMIVQYTNNYLEQRKQFDAQLTINWAEFYLFVIHSIFLLEDCRDDQNKIEQLFTFERKGEFLTYKTYATYCNNTKYESYFKRSRKPDIQLIQLDDKPQNSEHDKKNQNSVSFIIRNHGCLDNDARRNCFHYIIKDEKYKAIEKAIKESFKNKNTDKQDYYMIESAIKEMGSLPENDTVEQVNAYSRVTYSIDRLFDRKKKVRRR